MQAILDEGLSTGRALLLLLCILIAFGFEFVNGFHDTANAVATVIYTNTLRPRVAVILSGLLNFTGVFLGGIAVALAIIKLLPTELLVSGGPGAGLAMVLALLLAAIVWNVGTWYLGLPASSSHTLIGAVLGVGVAESLRGSHGFGTGVNWGHAVGVVKALLFSPLIGFALAAVLLLVIKAGIKRYASDERLLAAPTSKDPPPPFTRGLLVFTCGWVSFAHGSNDGQKGVGIVMLILMGLAPGAYALNRDATASDLKATVTAVASLEATVREHGEKAAKPDVDTAIAELEKVRANLQGKDRVADVPKADRFGTRQAMLLADSALAHLQEAGSLGLSADQKAQLTKDRKTMRSLTEYAPDWVLVAIAFSLGIGTMVGWKRIVVTVGEKIGKSHLTYAQGASAEIVAASTIQLASHFGLPVSTTHVLSSGITGTMVANRSGLQGGTVRNIALAWVLTLPVSMLLSAVLFLVFRALLA